MFVACGIWCLADVSSVSPSSEQTLHCLITKICELGACFLYFSYMLAQNGG